MSLLSEALDRLKKYNLGPFSISSNPFGLTGAGGPDTNLEPMLGDVATVGQASVDNAAAAADSAAAAAESASAADGSASAANSDAQAAHADRLAADADAQATAADRLAVAQDKTAAAGSASAAAGSATLADQYATASGGAIPAVRLTWDTATTDADPGNGKVRLNNATPSAATALYVDNLDIAGSSIITVLDRWTASTNATKGTLRIAHRTNATKWLEFQVTGTVVDGTGYRKIAVSGGTGPGGFAAGDPVAVGFSRAGDVGQQGPIGPIGATGATGAAGATGQAGPAGPVTTYWGGTAGGTGNALTATTGSGLTSLTRGQIVDMRIGASANTGAATLNVDSVGTKAIQKNGAALVAGDLPANTTVSFMYDGTAFQLVGGAGGEDTKTSIAAASIADIGTTSARAITITNGIGPITAWGTAPAGAHRDITFATAVMLTHNATSAILTGGGNITTAVGDTCRMESLGGGNWKMLSYQRANGTPLGIVVSQSLSASDKSSNVSLTDSNMTANNIGGGIGSGRAVAAIDVPRYWEVVVLAMTSPSIPGIAAASAPVTDYLTNSVLGWGYLASGYKGNNGQGQQFGDSWGVGARLCFAYNPANRGFWMGKIVENTPMWGGGGDPVAGTNPAYTIPTNTPVFPGYSIVGQGTAFNHCFGSSQQAGTAPSGYLAFT